MARGSLSPAWSGFLRRFDALSSRSVVSLLPSSIVSDLDKNSRCLHPRSDDYDVSRRYSAHSLRGNQKRTITTMTGSFACPVRLGDVGKSDSDVNNNNNDACQPSMRDESAPAPSLSSSTQSSPSTSIDLASIGCARMSCLFIPYLSSLPSRGSEVDDSKNYRLLVNNGFVFPSQHGEVIQWSRGFRGMSVVCTCPVLPFDSEASNLKSDASVHPSYIFVQQGRIYDRWEGMYHFLPLGIRVLNKLKRVIGEELENVGCQELSLSTLTSSRLWEKSGRWSTAGPELFRLKDRRDHELCLAPTCEENITAIMAEIKLNVSFKHLPVKLFQISTKYRDEVAARNGLLRAREFLMKDLYTFDVDQPAAESTYSAITLAYDRIFSRLSLPVYRVRGSPGKIGGSLSHEFQLPSPAGEDEIVVCQNCSNGINVELLADDAPWECGCHEPKILRTSSIELGHTFLLGQKYSSPFGSTYRDARNKDRITEMGCYGIGVSRLIAAAAEVSNPPSGSEVELVWPRLLAPFTLAIVPPKKGSKESTPEVIDSFLAISRNLNQRLSSSSSQSCSELLIDDRVELTIGRRVNDLRRIGVNFIAIFGRKFMTEGKVELIDVRNAQTRYVDEDELTRCF